MEKNEEEKFEDIIEGRNPVIEALKSGREINKILISKGHVEGSAKKIISMAKDKGIVVQYVDKNKIKGLSTSDNHQGVIAYISPYKYKELLELLDELEIKNEDPFFVICDEVNDPHNLGSIIRTANAAGANGVIIPKRRSAMITSIVAKTSAGAIEYVPVCKVTNLSRTIDLLKEKGVWLIGADMDGREEYFKSNLTGKIAIVVGNEGKGISRLVKEKCDFVVSIPMFGEVSSLNASVAASLLMYEVVRQKSSKK
ncbi:23S rRNA (guanosine(2251)-2'-O)-methyltransferase RlmB [Helicovermis profundi]|uniref:23S rRNA (Guanosine(2251)-2'-O)-methyltransferase RlmB n=2 Tax=Helicovermis profundi TaxID=3065157 RepID=A0AAU9E5Z9_9FIRM|nr:23S rRNA (guanosine(2251)-2'-O)-methyltransferase RlmB [Clostridia bacterium S502]